MNTKELIDNLIRDITKVGFMSKSEARRRIENLLQETIKEKDKEFSIRKITIESMCDQRITMLKGELIESFEGIKAMDRKMLSLKEIIEIIKNI